MSFKGRQQANRELISVLTKHVEENPDLRFGQILVSLKINQRYMTEVGVVVMDSAYEESTETLARVMGSIAEETGDIK